MAETQGIVIPSDSGEVQIAMSSANAAPTVVFQTHAQGQQPPPYSYQQTANHPHPPQHPGYLQPSTQLPGYQLPSTQLPGYHQHPPPHPGFPGYHQPPPQHPGYLQPSTQLPGYHQHPPQHPGYHHPYQHPAYQPPYQPPPQHPDTQQQLHRSPLRTEPAHVSRPVSSQPSRVAQQQHRHDNNTPSTDGNCCKNCCHECFSDTCHKDCSENGIWILIAVLAIIFFPITLLILPFVLLGICCKKGECCKDCDCEKSATEICFWVLLAIICFPIALLILPFIGCLYGCDG